MKMKTSLDRVLAALLLSVILVSCASPATSVPPTPIPPTAEPASPTPIPPTAELVGTVTGTVPTPAGEPDPSYYSEEPVAVVPEGVPGQPMITAAYNTSIRSGPGTNYPVYGAFLGSATAQAVGVSEDGQWYAISVPVAPGGAGWVSALYSLPQDTENLPVLPAPPVPPTLELVPPGPDDPQATALIEVYVRTGPGEQYPAYGIALTGANARVIGKSEDGLWLVVRIDPDIVGAGYGWVAAAYTQPANIESVVVIASPEPPPEVVVSPPPSGAATATAIDYVNLRSGPGTNYLILGVASPGASGELSGKSQDGAWWQVVVPADRIPAGVAWVSADWVSTASTESVPVVEAPPPPPTEVTTEPSPQTQCVLVSQDPPDGSTFPPSTGFGVEWVLQNTSDTAWDQGEADLVFVGAVDGVRLHQNWDLYDITATVQPGETYTVSGGLITPPDPGQYGEAWAIQQGPDLLCTFWILVNVQ